MSHSSFRQARVKLRQLPGLGSRLAERLCFYFVANKEKAMDLCHAIEELLEKMQPCSVCGLISEYQPCRICSSNRRDRNLLCLVKNAQDALVLERSEAYTGLYHVMGALISPLEDIQEEDLAVHSLRQRIQALQKEQKPSTAPSSIEILFAFEESAEAEVTMEIIRQKLSDIDDVSFSQLGVGVPSGTALSQLDTHTLKKSLQHRTSLEEKP